MTTAKNWNDVMSRADIPIVVICHNLVGDLRELVAWLERTGHQNLVLLDNASTYPPILEYLHSSQHQVIRLQDNLGHESPWSSGLVDKFGRGTPFVVTDPDVLPDESCPIDAVEHFQQLLLRYAEFDQAGFGLRIDDIPAGYPHRETVIRWEQPFWANEIEPGVFTAHIDTTFAAYRPGTPYKVTEALRTGSPYLSRHLPWYRNPHRPDPETAYYFEHRRDDIGYWNRIELPLAAVAAESEGRDVG